jgi:lipid A 3-O-deacylase
MFMSFKWLCRIAVGLIGALMVAGPVAAQILEPAQIAQIQAIQRVQGLVAPAQTTPAQTAPAQTVPAQTVQTQAAQTAQSTAQTPPSPAAVKILDEFKIGLLAHDVALFGHHRERGVDGNFELLFASPDILRYIWSPRPHIGVDANVNGKTTSYYAGLTWGGIFYQPGWNRDDGFFAYLAIGGSVNDGKISTTDPHRKSLGSHELFREGLDIGYRFNSIVSFSGFVDHISNANLANRNEGLTNAGGRVGFKF